MQEANLAILNYYLNKKNYSCVYVTVAKPYSTVLNIIAKNHIKTDKLFFIDCVTQAAAAGELTRAGNVVFSQPQALTNISIVLTNGIEKLPKDEGRVVVLDTLSTLMLYNEAQIVTRFVHSLTGKIRAWGIKSVILTLEEETDKKIIAQISQFCDKVIKA